MERELTREQREHLEALIRTIARVIGRLEMELERVRNEKKGHEVLLRDYGQPVLLAPDGSDSAVRTTDGDIPRQGRGDDGSGWLDCEGLTNKTLLEICDACACGEDDNLRTAMGIKRIKCMGMEFEVK